MAHQLARAFAVTTVDFLVMQNIMIGLFCECFAIISGILRKLKDAVPYSWDSHNSLWVTGLLKAEVVPSIR